MTKLHCFWSLEAERDLKQALVKNLRAQIRQDMKSLRMKCECGWSGLYPETRNRGDGIHVCPICLRFKGLTPKIHLYAMKKINPDYYENAMITV